MKPLLSLLVTKVLSSFIQYCRYKPQNASPQAGRPVGQWNQYQSITQWFTKLLKVAKGCHASTQVPSTAQGSQESLNLHGDKQYHKEDFMSCWPLHRLQPVVQPDFCFACSTSPSLSPFSPFPPLPPIPLLSITFHYPSSFLTSSVACPSCLHEFTPIRLILHSMPLRVKADSGLSSTPKSSKKAWASAVSCLSGSGWSLTA